MQIINSLDTSVYNLTIKLISTNATAIMKFISYLGSATVFITLSIAFIFILKNRRDSKYIAINLILVFILNRLLKIIIARPRPEILRLVQEDGYSFPSGHSMVSMGFYGFLIYLIFKNIQNKKIKYISIIFLSILILLIGISRIYLGVHYFTDVIGGFVIAIIYLLVFIKFVYKNLNYKGKRE